MASQPAKLVLLASLDTEHRVTDLAEVTDHSHKWVREVAKQLADEGVVTLRKEGRDLVVAPASPPLPELARALLESYAEQDWQSILHGDRPLFLHALHRVQRLKPVAEVLGDSMSGAHYTATTLTNRGILVRQDHAYAIHPRHRELAQFVTEYARLRAHHKAREIDPGAHVLWYLGPEALFKSSIQDPASEAVHPAAFTAFRDHGVDLVTGDTRYYLLSRRSTDAADAILQALLVMPDSKIHRSYSAIVYERTEPSNLREKARIYGLEEEAESLERYVTTREAPPRYLPWSEHERYRRQYGVDP